MSTPPKAGKSLSVRIDGTLSDDLATIMRTGMTASDAVRYAVAFLAHGYSWVWESGLYPDGVPPRCMAFRVPSYDGPAVASDGRMTGPPHAG
ncbi:hypothetical protein J7F03_28380 [Streptomyces sp. ISL-43]|uniref:hypothetical protein n=1 Tax=Streptomyces sp. ISL-43 TaxID=2819183 RepID=UPI001BE936EB|nr:hypothetical protein [Streptomyces sp. ISL-43]MBT2450922.1 hypothetical protein [Streptomyces sp. ISL-43]